MSDNDDRFRESQEAGARQDEREARRRFETLDPTAPSLNVIEFDTPILPTDADIPKSDDPRLKPMLQQLVDAGVMAPDGSGTCLIPSVKMRRGISPPNNWIWRFEWEVSSK